MTPKYKWANPYVCTSPSDGARIPSRVVLRPVLTPQRPSIMPLSDEIIVAVAIGIPSILVAMISLVVAYLTLALTRSAIRSGYPIDLSARRVDIDSWPRERRIGYEARISPSSTWSRTVK
jgi:hypothetical protein